MSDDTSWMVNVPHGFDAMGSLDDAAYKLEMDDIIQRGNPKHVRSHLHASTVLQPDFYKDEPKFCYRECVLAANCLTNQVNHGPKTVMIFQNGWELHKRWQRIFQNAGVCIDVEYPRFHTGYKLQFTTDGAIMFDGRPTIVEIKGYNSYKYRALAKGGLPVDAYNQCQLYLHLLRTKSGQPIHDGLVIVENKDSQEYKLWKVQYDAAPSQSILQRLDQIAAYCQDYQIFGDLPTGICTSPDDKRAQECASCDACFYPERRVTLTSLVPDGIEYIGDE